MVTIVFRKNLNACLKIILPVLILATGFGCGRPSDQPPLAPVTGRITMDGKPVVGKEVIFQPTEGRSSIGLTNENGEYVMKYTADWEGAIIGKHKVAITTPRGNMMDGGWREEIPQKYNGQTILTAEVKDEDNVINFDLTSE